MSDEHNLENLDLDLQRRIRISHLAVLVILCLASAWLIAFLILGDAMGAVSYTHLTLPTILLV